METNLIANGKYVAASITEEKSHLLVQFRYNPALLEEIKSMQGAKWLGFDEENPRKIWRIDNCPRNQFQLEYLQGKNPYAWYDRPLIDLELAPRKTSKGDISPYTHQREMILAGMTYRQLIFAAEMGTGKTLVAIYIMELSGFRDWWFVGTNSSLASVKTEFRFWGSKVQPQCYTYDDIKRIVANWPVGKKPPQGLIADEISRAKTPTSQRSQSLKHVCDSMRTTYGNDAYIIGMSGSPAPKDPTDWWHLCELACPGFLKEGTKDKLKYRLALIEKVDSIAGGSFPKLITWKDSELKCSTCGKEAAAHTIFTNHAFIPMVNEIAKLYRRMKGLVIVKLKKDCLDLPEKVYRVIKTEPDASLLRTAKLIKAGAKRAIEALTLMRELSDGFQYRDKVLKTEPCTLCEKTGKRIDSEGIEVDCHACGGNKVIKTIEREVLEIKSGKDTILLDLLEDHEDSGRLVVYAGFTASVDRVAKLCKKAGWLVIQFDGRGLKTDLEASTLQEAVVEFQAKDDRKIVFIGHPGSAGMGLTLTASRTIVYFSNDFNFESRVQSEDRIHRIGMDYEAGATIIDIVNLPSDEVVLKNLLLKKTLQSISLGELEDALKENVGASK